MKNANNKYFLCSVIVFLAVSELFIIQFTNHTNQWPCRDLKENGKKQKNGILCYECVSCHNLGEYHTTQAPGSVSRF